MLSPLPVAAALWKNGGIPFSSHLGIGTPLLQLQWTQGLNFLAAESSHTKHWLSLSRQ